jgi:hypothetical protein
MNRIVRQASRPVAPETNRTDHRLWRSVGMGVPPAKFHEKPMPEVGHASACQPAGRPGFLDPVIPCDHGSLTHVRQASRPVPLNPVIACEHGSLKDDKRRSSVPLVEIPETGREACPTLRAGL